MKKVVGAPLVFNGKQIPLSRGISANGFVFVSGQVPLKDGKLSDGDIETQTGIALDNVRDILREAGCTLADVVKTNVWLTDAADFPRFNAVYAEYFPSEPPARSLVVSQLVVNAKVEVEAIAYRPEK